MAKLVYRLSSKFVLAIIGLFLIGSLPSLFQGIRLNFPSYIWNMGHAFIQLLKPASITYFHSGIERSVFPRIFSAWVNSMELFMLGFAIAFVVALAAAIATMMLPRSWLKPIKFVLFILESLPDVLLIVMFQLGVIWIYQRTHWLAANVASFGNDDRAILLPVLVMAVLPAIMLYRTMVLDFEEEKGKPYIELARGKGLTRSTILLHHILRNAMIHVFLDSKFVIWFMLSSLVMVEYIFNVRGLTDFLKDFTTPEIFTLGLIMLFVPIFLLLSIGQAIIERLTAKEVGD